MAKRLKIDKTDLILDVKSINKKVADVTGVDSGKTFSIDDLKQKDIERDPRITSEGRKKFTTMLHPDLRGKLNNVAKNNQMSIADVLEIIVKEYFGIK